MFMKVKKLNNSEFHHYLFSEIKNDVCKLMHFSCDHYNSVVLALLCISFVSACCSFNVPLLVL